MLAEYLHLPDRGIDVLTEAIRLYPDCAPAILGRGVLLARQGCRDQALADARLGLKYDQGGMAHYQAACIFAQTSRTTRTDADEAMRLLFVARCTWASIARWPVAIPTYPRFAIIAILHA